MGLRTGGFEGRRLGEFVVRERIGAGGFASVHRAEQPSLDRHAVVKILHAGYREDSSAAERFVQEARLASRLDHPFAAHMYSFGVEPDGVCWIAMELVHGTPLDALLAAQGAMPVERAVPLLERVCEVVHAAHECGIVHRDIKPANIVVLSRSGRLLPKLLDFGVAAAFGTSEQARAAARSAPGGRRTHGRLGTPFYMAPEQWLGTGAEPAVDIYALGVLAFELLTGHPPFAGTSLHALRRAHARATIPPIDGVPLAVRAVVATAMAKKAANRHDDALDFAAALRDASGLDRPTALPPHDTARRARWIARGPRPIADALAVLDGARAPHHVREAVWQLVTVTARFVGVVALASVARFGGVAFASRDAARELIRSGRRDELTSTQWCRGALALSAPLRGREALHPIPELASFFLDGAQPLVTLAPMSDAAAPGGGEAAVAAEIDDLVPQVDALLAALEPLLDYTICVPARDHVASWLGAQRPRPGPPLRASPGIGPGQPVIVDSDQSPVLSLWPLVQVDAPTAGSDLEMFLFAGPGRNGARLVSMPSGFERHDPGVWEWFRDMLDTSGGSDREGADETRAPYRGLDTFTSEDAELYFGRERETDAIVNRLRRDRFIAIVGASGAGKSSLVQAGVIPNLPPEWRVVVARPGARPLEALRAAFARVGPIATSGDAVAALQDAVAGHEQPLLVYLDQFEEMFTLADHDDRDRALDWLLGAIERTGHVRVVVTLRDDFLMQAAGHPALRSVVDHGLMLLTTPAPEDLERAVREPAARVGYGFDDDELPGDMVSAVTGRRAALPLLSFAASKLWTARDRQFLQLTRSAYDDMGGVTGALVQHAEDVLTGMPGEQHDIVRRCFRALVTASGTRATVARSALEQQIGEPHAAQVVERLLVSRLLVTRESTDGRVEVELAHEALLTEWPRLAAWRRRDVDDLRLRDELRIAARQWIERERADDFLWRGAAVRQLADRRDRLVGELSTDEAAFARASLVRAARRRRVARGATIAAFAALIAVALALLWMNNRAESEREVAAVASRAARNSADEARDRLTRFFVEQGRQQLISGDAARAAAFAVEAIRRGDESDAGRFVLARAARLLSGQQHALRGHRGSVAAVAYSPAGSMIATGGDDGTVRLWDAGSGAELRRLVGHTDAVLAVEFSPDGSRLGTTGDDKTARVWNVGSGDLVYVLQGHRGAIFGLHFGPDGRSLLTFSDDASARMWDLDNGAAGAVMWHERSIRSASLTPDGHRVVTASEDHRATVWDANTGARLTTFQHDAPIYRLAVSSDGHRAVVGSTRGTLAMWSVDTGELIRGLTAHAGAIRFVGFSGDGSRLLTAAEDGVARVWDGHTGELLVALEGHGSGIRDAAFLAGDTQIATMSTDRSIRLWDASNGRVLAIFAGHLATPRAIAVAPDGATITSSDDDGVAIVWRATAQELVHAIPHAGIVRDIMFDQSGDFLLTGEEMPRGATYRRQDASTYRDNVLHRWAMDGWREIGAIHVEPGGRPRAALAPDNRTLVIPSDTSLELWSGDLRERIAIIDGHDTAIMAAAFSPDGRRLVSVARDPSPRVWDMASLDLEGVLVGHRDEVMRVRFGGGGQWIITVGFDGAIVWDANTLRELHRLEGHRNWIWDVHAVGDLAITASADGTARVWTIADGVLRRTLRVDRGSVFSAALHPSLAIAATGSADGTVSLWDIDEGRLLSSWRPHHSQVFSLAFSEDGRLLASGGDDVLLWDVTSMTDSVADIEAWARCHLDLEIVDDRPVQREHRCD